MTRTNRFLQFAARFVAVRYTVRVAALGVLLIVGPETVAGATDSAAVLAYVGPGAGLGMIGSLLAVLAAVAIGLFGLVLYPITLIRRMLRKPKDPQAGDTVTTSAK